MGIPEEEAGQGCQQHSMAQTLADLRNKGIAKTRRGEGMKEEEGIREGGDYELSGKRWNLEKIKVKDVKQVKVWIAGICKPGCVCARERERWVCVLAGGGRERTTCRLGPSLLPMVSPDTGPHHVPFSHSTALKHPSHPITADAGLPKRAGRA